MSRRDNAAYRDSQWRPPARQEHNPYDTATYRDHYWRDTKPKLKRSRTPDPRSNAQIGVTFMTRIDHDDGPGLIVESQTFTHPVALEPLQRWIVDDHLQDHARSDEAAIIIVEGYSEGLGDRIRDLVPRYPRYLNTLVRDARIRHPFVPAESGYGQCDVAFVLSHRGGSGYSRRDPDSTYAGSETCVGCWVGSVRLLQATSQGAEYRPVIVIVFPTMADDPNHYARLLRIQYQNHNHLFMRLRHQPQFIFMDLYRMFTKWDVVTKEINNSCMDAEEECFDRVSRVIPRVAALHRNLADLSLIRQQMHIHELARKRYVTIIETLPGPRNSRITMDDVRLQKQRLLDRLTDIEDELSTQMLVLDMLRERFQNLVDLEFNVASAKTDVRVAAISVLAFALVPVGFVASIFGISTMTAPVKWFAVAGSIVAVLSIALWFVINEYYSRVESESTIRPLVSNPAVSRAHKKRRRRSGDAEVGGFLQHDTSKVQYRMDRR